METVDKTFLKGKRDKIVEQFESVQKKIREIENQEAALAQQKAGFNVEIFRLQGENRLIEELIGKEPVEPKA